MTLKMNEPTNRFLKCNLIKCSKLKVDEVYADMNV